MKCPHCAREIQDDQVLSAAGHIASSRRQRKSGGTQGRPPVLRSCGGCGLQLTAVQWRRACPACGARNTRKRAA